MTTGTTVSPGQALVNMIESDLATVGGTPLETLLMNLKSHAGSKLAQGADIIAFTAQAPAAGFQLELMIEQQLLTLAMAKVQAYIASKTAPSPAPTPVAGA